MRFMAGYLNSIVRRGAMVVAAVAVAPMGLVHAANLEGVRVWAGPDYTRVVIDAEGPLHYTLRQNGSEVVVDLSNSSFSSRFSEPSAQGLLRGMSHARIGKNLRLTAKVHPDSHLKSFVLEPKSGNDYRLVLDLYPDSAAADRVASAQAAPKAAPAHSSRASTQQAAALLNGQRAVVVAIDAGHGGKDSGARGPSGTQEKNVTLAVARDLAAMINRQPGMKAVLTRDSDFYIPLKQRYKIARENNADLFVSIHADSFTRDDARGSSVWVLSPRGKTSEAARWLADRENRADLIGGTTLDDKDDGLAKVLLDLQQGWAMQASDVVASNVLKALAKLGPTHRGYVEKANFVVLRSPDVPSILVETAFISNPNEERKLRDPAHQKQLAAAVMGGVKNYFESAPPPGTWFAAQAAQRSGVQLASTGKPSRPSAPRADAGVRDLHKVNRGESLGSIARQYGVSVSALKHANQMSGDTVQAGVMLAIPTS